MASTAMTFAIDGSCARKTSDWPKDKMKIAAAASTAKLDFILQLGNALYQIQMVPRDKELNATQLQTALDKACNATMLMWAEKAKAVKSVISDKDSSFTAMDESEQDKYKDFVFDQFLRSANRTFVDTISTFLLPDGDKQKGAMVEALRAAVVTPEYTRLRQGDFQDWLKHEVLFHHGVTSTLGYYDKVHGKGFGKATKATIRKTICACSACALARGTATYRRANPPTPNAHPPVSSSFRRKLRSFRRPAT